MKFPNDNTNKELSMFKDWQPSFKAPTKMNDDVCMY